tara:strand:+ start:270 stop:824 length:555 start_codon:yes stop_codon:yes gene_type:complete
MDVTCSVFIATSLDGFIARPNGDVDWLDYSEYVLEGENFGYYEFMDSIDALIMGSNTYEKVLTFGEWHYSKPVFVLSSRKFETPIHLTNKVFFLNGELPEVLTELQSRGYHSFYIDGGKTIQLFLKQELINQLIITQIPILLGDGIPLFGNLKSEIKLKLISSQGYKNGFVKSSYEILKSDRNE